MAPNYASITFTSNDSNYSYNRAIKLPCGAVITGNTVEYKVDKNGQLFENGKLVSDKTIKLTKAQLAAIDVFSNLDGNSDDITPEELKEGPGWNLYYAVTDALAKVKSRFRLRDGYSANAGTHPSAYAQFERDLTPEEESLLSDDYDSKAATCYSKIEVDLGDCEN